MRASVVCHCLIVALAGLPAIGSAAVYKCALPGGGHEYRGTPCADASGSQVQVRDPTQPSRSGPASSGGTGAAQLSGDWCEFAVSLREDGELDRSAPATWSFAATSVRYRMKGMPAGGPSMPLRRDGAEFYVDDGMFGGADSAWTVVGQRNGAVVVHGPLGGYYHFRRGGC
jgi:hypothetical protein